MSKIIAVVGATGTQVRRQSFPHIGLTDFQGGFRRCKILQDPGLANTRNHTKSGLARSPETRVPGGRDCPSRPGRCRVPEIRLLRCQCHLRGDGFLAIRPERVYAKACPSQRHQLERGLLPTGGPAGQEHHRCRRPRRSTRSSGANGLEHPQRRQKGQCGQVHMGLPF